MAAHLVSSQVAGDECQLGAVHLHGHQDASLVGEHVQEAGVLHAVLHVGDPALQRVLGKHEELHLGALSMLDLHKPSQITMSIKTDC